VAHRGFSLTRSVCHNSRHGKPDCDMTDTPAKPRGRALGLPFDGAPGAFNAITDVAGVEVGTVTLIAGDGPLRRGR
jgi:hypothetical protein